MTPDAVASYLKDHPEFFEEYADFLASIYIPHPHGGRAISISERQILTLRDKGRQLEEKLRELIQFGEENDAIGEKLHRLTLALVAARDLPGVLQRLEFHLREDFAVPHVAARLWAPGAPPEISEASDEARQFAEGLAGPYCIGHAMLDTAVWFGAAGTQLRSFAYVPLRSERTLGLLALASEDPQRFYPEMGTLYVKRLGEVASAAITRSLAPA
jgi:hypothetical protein